MNNFGVIIVKNKQNFNNNITAFLKQQYHCINITVLSLINYLLNSVVLLFYKSESNKSSEKLVCLIKANERLGNKTILGFKNESYENNKAQSRVVIVDHIGCPAVIVV